MTIQEKIIYLQGEEKRLTEKAEDYASKGRIDSARAIMSVVTGVNELAADLAEDQVAWHLRGQKIWYDAPNGDQHYTERAQDLFNQYYDLFTESLTEEIVNA